jgi:hypothetical protein
LTTTTGGGSAGATGTASSPLSDGVRPDFSLASP